VSYPQPQDDARHPAPRVKRITTLVQDVVANHRLAVIEGPLWPQVGSIIELSPDNPGMDAEVLEVRLRLAADVPGDRDSAQIVVLVQNLARSVDRRGYEQGLATEDTARDP
jgi:hypothetical protein